MTTANTQTDKQENAEHIFPVRCSKGHISYFDKRRVCTANATIIRTYKDAHGVTLDDLLLKCTTCGEEMVASVSCEGYR
jgi:hypothetical protein